MEGSTDNLESLKQIRDLLPDYLQFKEKVGIDGKVDRGRNNTRDIQNPYNNNSIKTFASATNKTRAASLLRGKTLVMIWFDEYAFIPFNDTIYINSAPAYKTARDIAKQNNASYGILITTTPKQTWAFTIERLCLISRNCWKVLKLLCLNGVERRKQVRRLINGEIKAYSNLASLNRSYRLNSNVLSAT